MALPSRISRRQLAVLLIAATTLFTAQSLSFLFSALGVGIDFIPLRHAGGAILHGQSVYADPTFVYPPTAGPLFVPLAMGSTQAAFVAWLILSLLALVTTAAMISRVAPSNLRLLIFCGSVLALICSPVAAFSLFLGNLSVLLVPVAVLILLAFHRDRWLLGCALLAASLLVKPLLAPLLLLPVFRRRWRELALTAPPAGGLLLLAMLAVPGGRYFADVLQYCLSGTNLHGKNAINNLSLRGWVEAHHDPTSWGTVASGLVVIAVLARLIGVAVRQGPVAISPLWLGNLVLLTTLLAGRISEVHFLLTVLATVGVQLVVERSRFNALLMLPGLAMLAVPMQYIDLLINPYTLRQTWQVSAELLLLGGLVLSRRPEPVRAPTPGIVAVETQPELVLV